MLGPPRRHLQPSVLTSRLGERIPQCPHKPSPSVVNQELKTRRIAGTGCGGSTGRTEAMCQPYRAVVVPGHSRKCKACRHNVPCCRRGVCRIRSWHCPQTLHWALCKTQLAHIVCAIVQVGLEMKAAPAGRMCAAAQQCAGSALTGLPAVRTARGHAVLVLVS